MMNVNLNRIFIILILMLLTIPMIPVSFNPFHPQTASAVTYTVGGFEDGVPDTDYENSYIKTQRIAGSGLTWHVDTSSVHSGTKDFRFCGAWESSSGNITFKNADADHHLTKFVCYENINSNYDGATGNWVFYNKTKGAGDPIIRFEFVDSYSWTKAYAYSNADGFELGSYSYVGYKYFAFEILDESGRCRYSYGTTNYTKWVDDVLQVQQGYVIDMCQWSSSGTFSAYAQSWIDEMWLTYESEYADYTQDMDAYPIPFETMPLNQWEDNFIKTTRISGGTNEMKVNTHNVYNGLTSYQLSYTGEGGCSGNWTFKAVNSDNYLIKWNTKCAISSNYDGATATLTCYNKTKGSGDPIIRWLFQDSFSATEVYYYSNGVLTYLTTYNGAWRDWGFNITGSDGACIYHFGTVYTTNKYVDDCVQISQGYSIDTMLWSCSGTFASYGNNAIDNMTMEYQGFYGSHNPVYVKDGMSAGWYDATHVHTIAEAITNVSREGQIYVWDGVYPETNLHINKSLTITGNASWVSQINATGEDTVFYINPDYIGDFVGIYDMYLGYTDEYAIHINNDNVEITGCYFNECDYGVWSNYDDNNSNLEVSDCYFMGTCYNPIKLYSGVDIFFNDNYLDTNGGECGFYTNGTMETVRIHGNQFWDTYVTLGEWGDHYFGDIEVTDNYFEPGSDLQYALNIHDAQFNDTYIYNNTFVNVSQRGLSIDSAHTFTNSTISHNIFFNNNTELYEDVGENFIHVVELIGFPVHNTKGSNTFNNNTIYGNNIQGYETPDYINSVGLYIDGMDDLQIDHNDVSGYMSGIYYVSDSTNQSIHDNFIFNNNMGLYLTNSEATDIDIFKNYIYGNTEYGLYNDGYGGNDPANNSLIYNNYFNNTHNSYDTGTLNKYNITKTLGKNIINGSYKGGNYWYDYLGWDLDGDGLGDTDLPYDSDGDITGAGDLHPLFPMGMYPIVYVDDDQDPSWYNAFHVKTIPEGVTNVSTNGLIYVWNGTYNIPVDVFKGCTIIGNGTTATTIQNEEMVISASYVSVSDILFNDTTTGYLLTNNVSDRADINHVYVFNSTFRNSNNYGINFDGTLSQIYIYNNTFYDITNFPVYVDGADNSYFTNLNINGGKGGIYVSGDNTNIAGCIITNGSDSVGDYQRITIWDSHNTTIHDNSIYDGDRAGVGLLNADNCTVETNIIQDFNDTGDYGIYIDANGDDNLIYNNYIVSNTINAYEGIHNNRWNITKTLGTNIVGGNYLGGNYWDDYIGADTDNDTLGDTNTPYNSSLQISPGDYHPLWFWALEGVRNFNVYNVYGNETQLLTWDGFIGINTLVRHNLSHFPANQTSDDLVYNGTGLYTYYNASALTNPGQIHFYTAWYYLGLGFWSFKSEKAKLTKPLIPTDVNVTMIDDTHLNITWVTGNGANRTVLLRNNTWYSTNYTQGTVIYNGTGTYYILNITSDTQYITAWSFTNWTYDSTTLSEFSWYGVPVNFKGLGINCYNESNPSQMIPYNFMVRNANGTDVYQSFDNYDYTMINLSGFETTANVYIRVWTDGYHARERFIPVWNNQFYNLSFYLPRKNICSGCDKEGGGNTEDCILRGYVDSLSCSGNASDVTVNLTNYLESIINVEKYDTASNWTNVPSNKYTYNDTAVVINATGLLSTTTQVRVNYNYYFCSGDTNVAVYYCRVVETVETEYSTYDKPVEDAVVTFKRFMNTTGGFENVGDYVTDANGYIAIYLIPNVQYLVHITKDQYEPTNSSYVPVPANSFGQTTEKIFRLYRSTADYPEFNYTFMMKNIVWSFQPSGMTFRTGFTAWYNITSSDSQLEWYSMTVYSYNFTTRQWVNLSYQKGTNAGGGSLHYDVANVSGKYAFELWFKKIDYPAFELSQTGSFEKIIQYFSEWMLDIPDYAYYIILIVIMCIVSGFAFMYLGAGLLAGYVGLGIMAIGLLIKPVEIPLGSNLFGVPIMISGWLIFMITFIFYTVAIFLWSKM